MGRQILKGWLIALCVLAAIAAGAAFLNRIDIFVNGLFVGIMLAAYTIPFKVLPNFWKGPLIFIGVGWAVMEIAPELNFQTPNPACIGVLAIPALLILAVELMHEADQSPQTWRQVLEVIIIGEIAYLLPYLFATSRQHPAFLSGIGCWDIGCDKSSFGTPYYQYLIGDHAAGIFSLLLVIVTALVGSLVFFPESNDISANTADTVS